MDNRKWQAAAVASPPDVEAAPDDGYPTDGDPSSAVPATVPGARWFHQIGEEVRKVIEDGGLTPDAADLTQLSTAIRSMIVSAQQAVIIDEAVFEASVTDGEAVYWDAANNHFAQAQADGTGKQVAAGIADVTNGKLYAFGSCPVLAGLTPGARYYLSSTTPGAITTVAPAANMVQIGIAKSATEVFIDIDAAGGSGIPVGTVIEFTGTAAPSGFLRCPTAQTNISRTTYAALFAAIGTSWGAGDGATTFGIPWFPADYAAIQANGNVGTRTVGDVISHSHGLPLASSGQSGAGTGNLVTVSGGLNSSAAGGSANLAAGVRVLYCIKY